MKHLKKFNEAREHRVDRPDEAREVLSKIYDIVDLVRLGPDETDFTDFLVPLDQFITYANKYDGSIAGNKFDSLEEFKNTLEDKLESVISSIIYIAPFWFTRSVNDILNFGDVYSDTVYIQLTDFVSDLSREEQRVIGDSVDADECGLIKSVSGKVYLRIWWD